MKRFGFRAVALIAAGGAGPRTGGATPLRRPAPPPTLNQPRNAYSWAGPYLGGNLGYEWGSVSNNPTKPSGFEGGAQAGYNFQSGPWVFGIEGDIEAHARRHTSAPW